MSNNVNANTATSSSSSTAAAAAAAQAAAAAVIQQAYETATGSMQQYHHQQQHQHYNTNEPQHIQNLQQQQQQQYHQQHQPQHNQSVSYPFDPYSDPDLSVFLRMEDAVTTTSFQLPITTTTTQASTDGNLIGNMSTSTKYNPTYHLPSNTLPVTSSQDRNNENEIRYLSSLEDQASRMLMEQLNNQHSLDTTSMSASSTTSQQQHYPLHLQQQQQQQPQPQQLQYQPQQQQQQQNVNELLLQEFMSSFTAGGLNNITDDATAQQLLALLQQQMVVAPSSKSTDPYTATGKYQEQQQQPQQQSYPNVDINDEEYYHQSLQQQPQHHEMMMENSQTISSTISSNTNIQKLERHFVTIAHDGSILEATRTLTGYAPEVLLMTSIYDSLYDEDLPGFLCIKTQFWDKGQSDVEAFIRRRTINGEWLWLASKAISYISEGDINAVILEESLIPDDQIDIAQILNRITRITAILIQAVEAAWLAKANIDKNVSSSAASDDSNSIHHQQQQQQYEEETAAYQAVLDEIQTNGMDIPESVEELQQLIQRTKSNSTDTMASTISASTTLPFMRQKSSDVSTSVTEQKQQDKDIEKQSKHVMQPEKPFDPNSVVESVRSGVRLDFGMVHLDADEMKVIALVLAGRIRVDHVAPLVLTSFVMGLGMKGVADQFPIESELNTPAGRISHSSSATHVGQQHRSLNRIGVVPKQQTSPQIDIPQSISITPPPISVLNLSYAYIGNTGIEMLSLALYQENSCLNTLDISFCGIDEKGILTLARALNRRVKKKIPPLKGLILSGNVLSPRSASEIGSALSASDNTSHKRIRKGTHHRSKITQRRRGTGYDSNDTESSDDDEDGFTGITRKRRKVGQKRLPQQDLNSSTTSAAVTAAAAISKKDDVGLQVLHVAHCSLTAEALSRLLEGLGVSCEIKELNISSNYFGVDGATALLKFLEPKQRGRNMKSSGANAGGTGSGVGAIFPYLDRLDVSNNKLSDDGTTQLTRAILMRSMIHLVDLKLSSNSIGSGGIETIMNKLLQHNLISLSLDNNTIGDQGCQLVAASLQSMQSLARLNLGFNHIGCRGITSLMRSLVMCKSMRYLGLSGNILRISGAIALGYTLSQHPRLEELDVDNCCLGQAAQCHIVAGIISNRWVPMKRLKGFALGPPMVAIGALKPVAANLSNEECLRIRKDEQMKTILQWMETNRSVKNNSGPTDSTAIVSISEINNAQFLTPDFVSRTNDVHGTPSQNAYLRLLGWLSHIPFDDDELSALQMYFYDQDLDGDRGSDGHINLKLRGDLLAALDEKAADEIREDFPEKDPGIIFSAGLDLDKLITTGKNPWNIFVNFEDDEVLDEPENETVIDPKCDSSLGQTIQASNPEKSNIDGISNVESAQSLPGKERRGRLKPRITMFPQFEQQLLGLKTSATEMLEQEEDPVQHEIILTQYAEASLTILRQLRYHCMNSGLDGWRQSGLTRKVLIVDDSMVTRKLVSRAFEKANFIVDTACNGAEGVEKLKTSLYDIAFMDIDMPVMNGFEATKRLREWEDEMRPGARQPICALTATYVDDFERSELMKFKDAGLDVMESKPCNIPRLFKVVDDVAPMFSDLSISVMQKEKSDQSLRSSDSGNTSL